MLHAQAMMSEWGDILGAAGSYERAHICGNVPYELGRVRHSFERIGVKVSGVEMGEQNEKIYLSAISMFLMVLYSFLIFVALPHRKSFVLAKVALLVYSFISV